MRLDKTLNCVKPSIYRTFQINKSVSFNLVLVFCIVIVENPTTGMNNLNKILVQDISHKKLNHHTVN